LLLLVNFDPLLTGRSKRISQQIRCEPFRAAFWSLRRTFGQLRREHRLYKPDAPQVPPHPDAGFVPYILVEQIDYLNAAPWPTGRVEQVGPPKDGRFELWQ